MKTFIDYKFRPLWVLGIIIGLSLVIKLALFFIFYHGEVDQITQPDTRSYLSPASHLLKYGDFGKMFTRTPGYPTFIAVVFGLFGQQLSAVIVMQIILSSLLTVEAYFITLQLFRQQRTAYIAACLTAGNIIFFGYSLMILSDLLFAVAIGLVFLSGTYLFSKHRNTLALTFFLGLTLALATMIRPINYYLIIPVTLGAMWYFLQSPFNRRKIILWLFLLILPTITLIGGWQIRNKLIVNTYAYSNIDIGNLYWHYAGAILQKQYHLTYDQAVSVLKNELHKHKPMTFREKYDFMKHRAFSIIRQHPKDVVMQMLEGFPKLMLGTDTAWIQFFNPKINYSLISEAKADLLHFRFKKLLANNRETLQLVMISLPVSLLVIGYYFLIGFGLRRLRRHFLKENLFAHLFLGGCFLYFIILSSSEISYARFRMPFELLIMIYASYGLNGFIALFKKPEERIAMQSTWCESSVSKRIMKYRG